MTSILNKAFEHPLDLRPVAVHCDRFGFYERGQLRGFALWGLFLKQLVSQPFGFLLFVFFGVFQALQPAEYFYLHQQNGLENFLCVVFSHVVFLLLVDGVATATVAGGDVAFYLWGAV